MILVVGSTGFLGSEICRRLTASGKSVRGLVRSTSDPEKVARLKGMDVETVVGDLRDPASLAAACQGMDTVITTATTTVSMQPGDSIPITDQQGQLDLVQAARQAGVRKFVFISVPQRMEPCPLTTAKRTVEQAVISSGMDYTILCPCLFMEVWLSPIVGFDYPNAKATIYGDGHAKNAYISRENVAEYVVQSLDNPATRNTLFELGYPQMHSQLEAVRIFEQASGKAFELQFVPVSALEAQRDTATDPLQCSFAAMMHNLSTGLHVDISIAQKVFPDIKMKSVSEVASRA
ncbi:MAG TPA: SDR family oxidoreductase [Anaerolineales bacterium]|nr:SDR family oxidoreductase [Anaerolineales bacterium]